MAGYNSGMSTDESHTPSDSRIGFRDIYRAVGESEARITARINEAFTALAADASDHEARIRIIEAAVTPLAILSDARDRRLEQVEKIAGGAAAAIDHFKAAQGGALATLGAGKQLIVIGAAIAGGVVAAVDIVTRFS